MSYENVSLKRRRTVHSSSLQLNLHYERKGHYVRPVASSNNYTATEALRTRKPAADEVKESTEDVKCTECVETRLSESLYSASLTVGKLTRKRIHSIDDEDNSDLPPLKRCKQICSCIGDKMKTAVVNIWSGTKNTVKFFTDIPTSKVKLEESEQSILNDIGVKGKLDNVVVEESGKDKVVIHTITFDSTDSDNSSQFPLVLIHGYAGGLACFHRNFSSLCKKRRVYAIDLPGFALSSRIKFPDTPLDCKDRIVALVEKWREAMKLEKFILLGHSFGGYISASYTIKYKERVRHLILTESWGILGKHDDPRKLSSFQKLRIRLSLNPYAVVRRSLVIGYYLHDKCVPKKIKSAYGKKFVPYLYHANVQPKPAGEEAFAAISDNYLWPHDPLKEDLSVLDHSVPITFLCGSDSDSTNEGGKYIKGRRKNVFLPVPLKGGHHIQAEDHEEFNERVNEVCDMVDKGSDREDEHHLLFPLKNLYSFPDRTAKSKSMI